MSIAHVFSSIVTQKNENQKNVLPHRNHDFYYFFCKSVLSHTKKVNSHYNTQKKFIITQKNYSRIIEIFIEYNEKYVFKLIF